MIRILHRICIISVAFGNLVGCSLFTSQPSAVAVCLPIASYSRAFLSAFAAEEPSAGPHVQQMLRDYLAERDRLRACHG